MAKAKVLTEVVVEVDQKHRDSMQQVSGRLKKKGFVLDEQLDAIGILTGSVADESVEELKDVEGVANVEKARKDYRALTH